MRRTTPKFRLVGKVPITIQRMGEGGWEGGRWKEGVAEPIEIEAHVQPANMQTLLLLPESERTKQAIRVFSVEEIRTAREGDGGWQADIIEWNNDTYRVMKVESYVMGVLDHFHAVAVREPITPN